VIQTGLECGDLLGHGYVTTTRCITPMLLHVAWAYTFSGGTHWSATIDNEIIT